MQFQSDILQVDIHNVKMAETTSLGAAFLAGLATGFFPSLRYIENIYKEIIHYLPKRTLEEVEILYKRWKNAVETLKNFI